jgi:hypothetical protein
MNNEQLVAWIKKNPIIVGCASLSLVLAILLYFTSDSVPQARSQLEELSTQEAKLQANIEYSAKLQEQYKELTDANAAIVSRMVRSNQLALNLQYFYKLESDTGTKLVEVHQVPPGILKGARPTYEPVAFGVAVDGDFPSVVDVLRRLEDSPHLCRINSASLGASPNPNGGPSVLHLSLDIQLEGIPQ